jgi:hypothetical protein
MKTVLTSTLALGLTLALTTGASAAPKCIKAGGTGTGVTLDFAKFMSGAAAKNSAKAWGGDAVKLGPLLHACDAGFPFSCKASVKACK